MSVLFPKVNKPREWDYRPIYYDAEKEARKDNLARLHRGSFREEHEKHKLQQQARAKSRLAFFVVLALGIALVYYLLR